MARPKLGESESKRLQMVITEDELNAIDEWQHKNRIPSKSEAIRRLCQLALQLETGLDELVERANSILSESEEASYLEIFGDDRRRGEFLEGKYEDLFGISMRLAGLGAILDSMRRGVSFEDAIANVIQSKTVMAEILKAHKEDSE